MTRLKPFGDDVERVPQKFTVNDTSSGGGHDTDNSAEGENDWEEGKLDELSLAGASITGEIGNVASKC